jgi:hypothetical protein
MLWTSSSSSSLDFLFLDINELRLHVQNRTLLLRKFNIFKNNQAIPGACSKKPMGVFTNTSRQSRAQGFLLQLAKHCTSEPTVVK